MVVVLRERRSSSSSSRGNRCRTREVKPDRDRISKLPDHLINHILSFVNPKVAVKTMILSKRWVNVWTSFTCLNFVPFMFHRYENFVMEFLKNRDQRCHLSKFSVDCYKIKRMLKFCLDYALSHNVEHLFIRSGDFVYFPCLHSACLRTLHLESCQRVPPMDCWNLPSLTSLNLHGVRIGNQISGFENLKELTLVEIFDKNFDDKIIINCPNLQSLALYFDFPHKFMVSAPSLSYLNYRSRHETSFFARDGFPCIKQVHIDIRKDALAFNYGDKMEFIMENFIGMLNAVRGTPFLKLSSDTVEVLQMVPDLSRKKPCPLGNLKFLSLQGPYEMSTRSTGQVINYFLSSSPSAKIVECK